MRINYSLGRQVVKQVLKMFSESSPTACGTLRTHFTKPFSQPDAPDGTTLLIMNCGPAVTLAKRPSSSFPLQVADVVAFCQDSTAKTNDEPEGGEGDADGGSSNSQLQQTQDKEARQLPN